MVVFYVGASAPDKRDQLVAPVQQLSTIHQSTSPIYPGYPGYPADPAQMTSPPLTCGSSQPADIVTSYIS